MVLTQHGTAIPLTTDGVALAGPAAIRNSVLRRVHGKSQARRRVLARCIAKIGTTIANEENRVRVGMGAALMSIGKRNKKLNAAAIKVATAIGPVHFSDGGKRCEPMNMLKHLTSDHLRNKLGM